MTSKRSFYKTTYVVEVLSEEPIPDDLTLRQVITEAEEGGYSSQVTSTTTAVLDGPTAARELLAQQSDSAFFQLTEDGDDLEEDEEFTAQSALSLHNGD
jgi:hypothetical protein